MQNGKLHSFISPTSDSISHVIVWMNNNRPNLNYDKTEFTIIGIIAKKLSQTGINIDGHMITVKSINLCVTSDHDKIISMSSHVTSLC